MSQATTTLGLVLAEIHQDLNPQEEKPCPMGYEGCFHCATNQPHVSTCHRGEQLIGEILADLGPLPGDSTD